MKKTALLAVFILTTCNLHAAPGDILRRIDLGACNGLAGGLAFDGAILYYTVRFEPEWNTVHMVDAKTGAPKGQFIVNRGGVGVEGALGLEYDPNRNLLWVGGGDVMYVVSPSTGDVQWEHGVSNLPPVEAITYDPIRDLVWAAGRDTEIAGWCAKEDGVRYATISTVGSIVGLAFDGIDLWSFVGNTLPPPAPNAMGLLVASDFKYKIDYSRLLDPPDPHNDLAFDCVTFPVPVVWAANNLGCELDAIEVASRGACLTPTGRTLMRTRVNKADHATIAATLPLVMATAERVFRAPSPLLLRDDTQLLVIDTLYPIAFYRVLGTGDVPQGNILKLTKDSAASAVVARE